MDSEVRIEEDDIVEQSQNYLGISNLLSSKCLASQVSFGPIIGTSKSLSGEQHDMLRLVSWCFVKSDKTEMTKSEPFELCKALDKAKKMYKPLDGEMLDVEFNDLLLDARRILNNIMEEVDDMDLDDDEVEFKFYVQRVLKHYGKESLLDDPDDLAGVWKLIADTTHQGSPGAVDNNIIIGFSNLPEV